MKSLILWWWIDWKTKDNMTYTSTNTSQDSITYSPEEKTASIILLCIMLTAIQRTQTLANELFIMPVTSVRALGNCNIWIEALSGLFYNNI